MPPKAEYWKYFNVVGVVAYCLIAECKQPNVSLGALPKPGEKFAHLLVRVHIVHLSRSAYTVYALEKSYSLSL